MASDLYSVQETIEQQRDFTVHRFQNDLANKKQILQAPPTTATATKRVDPFAIAIENYVDETTKERQVTTQLR